MCEQQSRAEFREAMRRVAGTVFLITTERDGELYGIAATAVTSLSMEPPSLLACVNQAASVLEPLQLSKRFCVNILAEDQASVSGAFSDSTRRSDRFKVGAWERDPAGCPRFAGAVASISCALEWRMNWATHAILAGRVEAVTLRERTRPLLYHAGRYGEFAPAPVGTTGDPVPAISAAAATAIPLGRTS